MLKCSVSRTRAHVEKAPATDLNFIEVVLSAHTRAHPAIAVCSEAMAWAVKGHPPAH